MDKLRKINLEGVSSVDVQRNIKAYRNADNKPLQIIFTKRPDGNHGLCVECHGKCLGYIPMHIVKELTRQIVADVKCKPEVKFVGTYKLRGRKIGLIVAIVNVAKKTMLRKKYVQDLEPKAA